jgi:hypothetical protein
MLGLYFCERMLPSILALDFDGVICDGMAEYFDTSWQVYCEVWGQSGSPPAQLFAEFSRVRPAIEYGWEMPLLLWALVNQVDIDLMTRKWAQIMPDMLTKSDTDSKFLTKTMDGVRDRAIANNVEKWLGLQRCYEGTVQRLLHLPSTITPMIVTTKDGRFTRQMLAGQGVQLPANAIFGKEMGRSKADTLRQLLLTTHKIWFVEDRLPTLEKIAALPDLQNVELFLADWGYNTLAEREAAHQNSRVTVISLDCFNNLSPEQWR